ncbi:MAG: rhomboid family intramembrane serine protease [Chitinophagales bacterium]|nr:rhomboid family intramembrane serine protease [Chitinophagales bacterium]MDW8427120.1 rhomboid family intramembrane serine protease [Chitinophagales bacterium]
MSHYSPGGFNILPPAVKNLLILNGLAYLATMVFYNTFHIDLVHPLGLYFVASPNFHLYQFITHMFMHGNFMHIFSNMFALWMFGSVLENTWGSLRFLIFYFTCGLGGALAHQGVTAYEYTRMIQAVNAFQQQASLETFATLMARYQDRINYTAVLSFIEQWKLAPDSPAFLAQSRELAMQLPATLNRIPVVGASGAVFGVLAAFAMLYPNVYLYFYFLVPIKAKYFVLFYTLFELYAGFSGSQTGVAHFAHLGGAVVGYLLTRWWKNWDSRYPFP